MLIFLIKFAHTLIFFWMSASNFVILHAAIVNRVNGWTKLALVSMFAESAVLIAYGWQCPLRLWAEALGAERGSVTDIFLPRWLADRIFTLCTPLLLIGCTLLAYRQLNGRGRIQAS